MKVLIVDDEPHVIAVAKLLVDWGKYGIHQIFQAASAESALKIIRVEKPQIVISDIRLPVLNGLQLIEEIKQISPESYTILITAFSDFSYAQKAVQLGCVDFLLKPLTEEALNDAVKKAVAQYNAHSSLLADSCRNSTQNSLSLFFTYGMEQFNDLCKVASFFSDMDICRVGVICTRHLPYAEVDIYSLAAIAHNFFYQKQLGGATLYGSNGDIVFLLKEDGKSDLVALCNQLATTVASQANFALHMGLSVSFTFPEKFDLAFQMARENALTFNLLNPNGYVHLKAPPVPSISIYTKIENSFYPALISGHQERLLYASQEFTKEMLKNNILTIRNLENFRSTYIGFRVKWIQSFQQQQGYMPLSPPSFRGAFCLSDGCFSAEKFVQELYKDLKFISTEYLPSSNQQTTLNVIKQIYQYIIDHYSEDLSLDNLAIKFSISTSYLSRAFKKEYNIGLVDFITNQRIDKAKHLIKSTHMKLNEISETVGFSDAKYFSRVFKKLTNQTPIEYKNSLLDGGEKL